MDISGRSCRQTREGEGGQVGDIASGVGDGTGRRHSSDTQKSSYIGDRLRYRFDVTLETRFGRGKYGM